MAEAFPEQRMIATLSKELGRPHFVELLPSRNTCRDRIIDEGVHFRWMGHVDEVAGILHDRSGPHATQRNDAIVCAVNVMDRHR